MTITSVHIYYPSEVNSSDALAAQTVTAYDLRKVTGWSNTNPPSGSALARVKVSMQGLPEEARLIWPKAEFESAKAASLTGGG